MKHPTATQRARDVCNTLAGAETGQGNTGIIFSRNRLLLLIDLLNICKVGGRRQPNGLLAGFTDDVTARGNAGAWEIPTPVAGEIALRMLASMCAFGMIVIFLRFAWIVVVEGLLKDYIVIIRQFYEFVKKIKLKVFIQL